MNFSYLLYCPNDQMKNLIEYSKYNNVIDIIIKINCIVYLRKSYSSTSYSGTLIWWC